MSSVTTQLLFSITWAKSRTFRETENALATYATEQNKQTLIKPKPKLKLQPLETARNVNCI